MSLTGYERLPLDSQRRLDGVCAEFERCWAGPSPDRLAERVAGAPAGEADVWLTELLHIEIERARRAGADLRVDLYRAGLPAFADVIASVLGEYRPAPGAGDLVGKYRLIRPIGRGASGTVFEAEDSVIGRRVAVKLLTGPAAASRTVQEARAVGRLQHPNIVTVHDAGSADGVWYIAMELLAGSAADRLKEVGPFAPSEATRIIADVSRGLSAAHAAGLVHRDIKPANVLLAPAGGGGTTVAKLSDFGLARAGAHGATDTAAGTPLYMAPEQFDGRSVGPSCDIYSLGATYFALLTGRPPYQSATVAELRQAHETAIPPPVTTSTGALLPRHSRLVARAMAKTAAGRYASADALLSDLERLLDRPRAGPARRAAIVAITALVIAAAVLAVPGPAKWLTATFDRSGASAASPGAKPTWVPLFNGNDFSGWVVEGPGGVTVQAGPEPFVRLARAQTSVTTAAEHENYHLRFEARWPANQPTSGGLRYHITLPVPEVSERGWDEFSFDPTAFGRHRHSVDRDARAAALRNGRLILPGPDSQANLPNVAGGEWHRIDLICWQGVSVHAVDGATVSVQVRSGVARGRIELIADRGPLDVRRIEMRSIAGVPADLQGHDR